MGTLISFVELIIGELMEDWGGFFLQIDRTYLVVFLDAYM